MYASEESEKAEDRLGGKTENNWLPLFLRRLFFAPSSPPLLLALLAIFLGIPYMVRFAAVLRTLP